MKKNFLRGGLSIRLFALVAVALMCCVSLTSCQKENKNEGEIITRTQGDGGTSEVVIGNHSHLTQRTWDGGQGHSYDHYLMKDTSYNVPFAGVGFEIDPNDTLIGTLPVTHVNFNAQPIVISEPIDTLGWHATKKTLAFTDGYGQYSKVGGVFWYDNIWTIIWDDTVRFVDANVTIDYYSHNSTNVGSDNEWIYTLVTSTYKLSAVMGEKFTNGQKTIKTEKASVQGFTVIDSSFVVIAFDGNGNPTKARSTVDAIRDGEPLHIETTLNSSAIAAADTTVEASDFNLVWSPINVGTVVNLGNTPDVNNPNITKTNWTRPVSVGATGLFTRVNRYNWQTASWTDGTYSVNLPSRGFTGFIESHTLDAMSPVTGFNRKLATNTVTASFDNHSGTLNDRTTVKVAADDPGPGPGPDPDPDVFDSTLINPVLLYQDPTHGVSKVTKRVNNLTQGTHTDVDIVAYPENGYECLSSGVFYGPLTITGIDWGTPTFVSSRTSGDIRYDKYEVTAMIHYGVGIHKDFKAWVEWPVYVPMGYAMLHGEYSFAVSALNFIQSLGQTTTQNTTYNKGLYEQQFTGTLYNHTNQYGCDIEVWEQDYIPRESPTCFGAVQNMTFSMAEPAQGQTMVECKVVEFEHGWAIICQGQTNFYAKAGDNACSGYQTLPATNSSGATINYQSGIKVNGTWYPATVTPTGNWQSWTYGCRINGQLYTLTIAKSDAIINGVGGNGLYKPIPDAQAFSMSGPVGILQYSHNNLTDNMNATFMFW